jgi:hypothetical protein
VLLNRGLWENPVLSIPLLLKTVSMAQIHNHQERTKLIREAEDKHLSCMLYYRSFASLANFTNRVSYKKASSADSRKRKPHHYVESTAPHKRSRSTSIETGSSSPATDEIVVNGSTPPERLIANNATHSFIWISGLEYSNNIEKDYFEWFTIPKVNIGMYTIVSIYPAFEQSNFSALLKTLGYGFVFIVGKVQRVHQGVLIMEIIKHSQQRRTIYQKLKLLLA